MANKCQVTLRQPPSPLVSFGDTVPYPPTLRVEWLYIVELRPPFVITFCNCTSVITCHHFRPGFKMPSKKRYRERKGQPRKRPGEENNEVEEDTTSEEEPEPERIGLVQSG